MPSNWRLERRGEPVYKVLNVFFPKMPIRCNCVWDKQFICLWPVCPSRTPALCTPRTRRWRSRAGSSPRRSTGTFSVIKFKFANFCCSGNRSTSRRPASLGTTPSARCACRGRRTGPPRRRQRSTSCQGAVDIFGAK